MEPIEGSETSDFRTQTPGNYPKENILPTDHVRKGDLATYRSVLQVSSLRIILFRD